jgi:hypothetical protein
MSNVYQKVAKKIENSAQSETMGGHRHKIKATLKGILGVILGIVLASTVVGAVPLFLGRNVYYGAFFVTKTTKRMMEISRTLLDDQKHIEKVKNSSTQKEKKYVAAPVYCN